MASTKRGMTINTRIAYLVAYLRTSTADQDLGIDAQRAAIERIREIRGAQVIREFVEHESGGKNERIELDRAILYARRQRAILVVGKLDRLSRRVEFLMKLWDGDVPILFCDMPDAEGDTPAGRAQIQMMAVFAELELGMIGKRTKDALTAYKQLGKTPKRLAKLYPDGIPADLTALYAGKLGTPANLTHAHRIEGARKSAALRAAKARQDMADIAQIAIAMQADGKTLGDIARHLNANGECTRNQCQWSPPIVARILRRERLAMANE